MASINFFHEDVEFPLKKKSKLRTWIEYVIVEHGSRLESLNFIFCSDKHLIKINREYLHHDTYTDIITFDNSAADKMIEGDIFISYERVRDNSKTLHTKLEDELHRVMIHGVLHLLGYTDHTEARKRTMREKEDACLSLREL